MKDKYGVGQVLYTEEDDQLKQMTKLAADKGANIATEAASKVGTRVIAKLTTRKRKGFLGGWRTRRAEKKNAKSYEKKIEPYKPTAKGLISEKLEKELSDKPKATQTMHSVDCLFTKFSAGTELEELLF